MNARAFVLGGGVAGITAAFRLNERGFAVTLFESHRGLGGRAFSRHDERIGDEIDNGPHVVLGCYDAFRALLRRLGTEGDFVRQDTLTLRYRESGGHTSELRLPPWSPKLGLAWSALRLPRMGIGARLRLLRGAVCATLRGRKVETLETWLVRHRQHAGPRRFLWDPLCRAIFNAPPSAVSARLFLGTLMRALGRGRAGAAIWFPRAGWSKLLGEPAEQGLARAGVAVRVGAEVARLESSAAKVGAIVLRSGERIAVSDADLVVSALPWHVLPKVLTGSNPAETPHVPGAAITTVHFAGIDLPDEGPLLCLVDGEPFHFLCRRPGAANDRFALLASGDFAGSTRSGDAEAKAREQLARYFPGCKVTAGRARVIRMANATALFGPADAQRRVLPGRHPRLTNLWICGDATATGLPTTLEGAAVSALAILP